MATSFTVASSGNVSNATAAASLTASANFINYITGFHVTGAGATAALPVNVTVTGCIGGTLNFTYCAGSGVLAGNVPLSIIFPDPIPATGPNTAITVSCPALGAGNTANSVVAYGLKVDCV